MFGEGSSKLGLCAWRGGGRDDGLRGFRGESRLSEAGEKGVGRR